VIDPLVTIVVPTIGGRDAYLRQAIASALGQQYTRLEVLVSDNASGDIRVESLVAEFADDRLAFRRNDVRLPMAAHFNECLGTARGPYVLILQDDDYLSPNYVDELVQLAAGDRAIAAGFGRTIIVDADGATLYALSPRSRGIEAGHKYALDMLLTRDGLRSHPMSMLADRQLLLESGGFLDAPHALGSDIAAAALLAASGRVAYSPRAEYFSRWHGANALGAALGPEAIISAVALAHSVRQQLGRPRYDGLALQHREHIAAAAEVAAVRFMLGPVLRTFRQRQGEATMDSLRLLAGHAHEFTPWTARAAWWYVRKRCWNDLRGDVGVRTLQYLTGRAVPWTNR
jgi:glycosyltransferase involved in cell wall biosynthesis